MSGKMLQPYDCPRSPRDNTLRVPRSLRQSGITAAMIGQTLEVHPSSIYGEAYVKAVATACALTYAILSTPSPSDTLSSPV